MNGQIIWMWLNMALVSKSNLDRMKLDDVDDNGYIPFLLLTYARIYYFVSLA